MTTIQYPESNDLRELVRFSEKDGTIWLAENRMVLMHTASLGALRKELIGSVGKEHTRRLLTRMGYAAGVRDAELAKRTRGHQSAVDAFLTGPQLHMLEGVVRVTPTELHMDVEKGEFNGEFLWENSWEQEVHIRDFGQSDEPVCWSQIGYASGYTSAFMGRFILFKEVECVACGHNNCRIVGKPLEEWEDAEEHANYFQSDSMLTHLLELRTQIDYLRTTITQQTQTPQLVGNSKGFKHAYDLVSRAAETQVSVLLLGETGVGKERFARTLHQMSKRRQGPFVADQLRGDAQRPDRIRTVRRRERRLSPGRIPRAWASSSAPTAAPCSSTKSANCRSPPRPSCCACCRKARSNAWATITRAQAEHPPGRRHQRRPAGRRQGRPLPLRPVTTA